MYTGRLRGEVRPEARPPISTAARSAYGWYHGSQREAEMHVQPLLSGEATLDFSSIYHRFMTIFDDLL